MKSVEISHYPGRHYARKLASFGLGYANGRTFGAQTSLLKQKHEASGSEKTASKEGVKTLTDEQLESGMICSRVGILADSAHLRWEPSTIQLVVSDRIIEASFL